MVINQLREMMLAYKNIFKLYPGTNLVINKI